METLDSLFFLKDINFIKKQRPIKSKEDFWCWDHTKNGDYTVKSGYWLANSTKNPELVKEALTQPSLNGLKSQIWDTFTVSKIKAFMWRAASDALPVTDLIIKRRIKLDSRCQICGQEGESVNHVLFTCTLARQVWALTNFPSPPLGFDPLSVHSNLHYLLKMSKLECIPVEIRRRFPWILWRLWKNRNYFFFEAKMFDPEETVQKIIEDTDLWCVSQHVNRDADSETDEDRNKSVSLWSPPPPGWLKCNISISSVRKNKISGGAWVVRDHQGHVILHSRRALDRSWRREEVELQSLLWAVESMNSHKFSKIIFAFEYADLFGVITRPRAWPSFAHQHSEIILRLAGIQAWRVFFGKTILK